MFKLACDIEDGFEENNKSGIVLADLTTAHDQWWILDEANEAAASGPPFLSCRGAPLLKTACVLLGYFVAF